MKRNNHESESTADAGVLAEFSRLRATLSETHRQIPQLLQRQRDLERELGASESVELKAQLADVVQQRQAAARRRAASMEALLGLGEPLKAERAAVEIERQNATSEAGREFAQRWQQACNALAALRAEASVLGTALRTTIPTPAPFKGFVALDGSIGVRPVAEPVTAAVLPAHLSELGQQLDKLDTALSLCNAIRQSRELDTRHHRMGLLRGTSSELGGGVYRVLAPFPCMTDGLTFETGALIDGSLISTGAAHRLQTGRRFIAPVGLEA